MKNNVRREKDFGSKKDIQQSAPDVNGGLVEFKMSRVMAEEIIKSYKGNRKDP